MLSALFEYFANASQEAIRCQPPHRGRIEMTHYDRYTLVIHEVAGLIHRRWFLDESPIFSYHLPPDARRQLVGEIYRSGCRASEIAELLGVTDSVVSSDLKFLRAHYPNRVEPQFKPLEATPPDRILKSTTALKPESYQPSQTDWLVG
jgi:hypothetical protein